MFTYSMYYVSEDDGAVEVLLNITNPSTTAFIIVVRTTDGSATSE